MTHHVFKDLAAWRKWLLEFGTSTAVTEAWLTTVKEGVPGPTTLTYADARDEALCHGWIDSRGKKVADGIHEYRFSRRKPFSYWSKCNVQHVERLEAASRIFPAGRALIDTAKADGRWDAAYAGSPTLDLDAKMVAAIEAVPEAWTTWGVLTHINKFIIAGRYNNLKTADARKERLKLDIAMLSEGKTPVPQKQKPKFSTEEAIKSTAPVHGTLETKHVAYAPNVDSIAKNPVLNKTRSGRVTRSRTRNT